MILVGNTVISDDIKDNNFVCHLEKCKGGCCIEGDLGAPLEEEELLKLEEVYEHVKPFLSEKGIKEIERQGKYIKDFEDDFSTPTIEGRECAYAIFDQKGILKCGIEQAYLVGKTNFQKPISCHLYPIRITKFEEYDAINYDRWSICHAACSFGKALNVPLYRFLKDALIRKYGNEWYQDLLEEIEGKIIPEN